MKNSKKKIVFKYIFPILITAIIMTLLILIDYLIPSRIVLINNEESQYEMRLPFFISARASLADDISAVTSDMAVSVFAQDGGKTCIKPASEGETKLTLKFLGLLSIKDVIVKVIPDTAVYAGGDVIGISIKSEGLVVVDFTGFKNTNNVNCNPASDIGLKKGDMILKCNGEAVTDSDDFADIVRDCNGEVLQLSCIRDGIYFDVVLKPAMSKDDNVYRVGMWVRDGADGIGTLTFVDKVSGVYGAIGHGINDSDLNMLYSVGSGKALKTSVIGINKGENGNPGEMKGIFSDINNPVGDVRLNCSTGVYGKYFSEKTTEKREIKIGMSHEIQEGKAIIITSLDDEEPKEYEIKIEKIYKNRINSPKSMTIRVTDEKLIEKTGGIVQGMSGSPIIQNGKLVGAVTHVFVNDSTMGYGIFIESMLNNVMYASKYNSTQ